LIWANSAEYRLWFGPTGAVDRVSRLTLRLALLKFRIPGRVARLYRSSRPGAKPGEILGEIATDLLMRGPLNRLADSVERAYVYEFAWRSPVLGLGPCHGLEIDLVLHTLRHCRDLPGDDA